MQLFSTVVGAVSGSKRKKAGSVPAASMEGKEVHHNPSPTMRVLRNVSRMARLQQKLNELEAAGLEKTDRYKQLKSELIRREHS